MVALDQLGGGVVRRRFSRGGEIILAGHVFSGEELRSFRSANLRALIDKGVIEVWPKHAIAGERGARFPIHQGFGKYDVVEGRKLNTEPLTREQAQALVTSASAPDTAH